MTAPLPVNKFPAFIELEDSSPAQEAPNFIALPLIRQHSSVNVFTQNFQKISFNNILPSAPSFRFRFSKYIYRFLLPS